MRSTVAAILILAAAANDVAPGGALPGFDTSRHFGEQIKVYSFDPDVQVHINAPAADSYDPDRPTRLVLYALPNGNTTAQTIGRRMVEGLDWHFDIQHIGAQIRRLREVVTDCNLVIAYLEADSHSWPAWCREHAAEGAAAARLIDSVRTDFAGREVTVELASHSGGGSLIFAFVNRIEQIPNWIQRIVFLDSDYGYSDEHAHGDKLIEWLRRSHQHHLGVYAYDDRRVRLNGKLIVGPEGGTYRNTQRMLERFRRELPLTESNHDLYRRFTGLDGQIDVIVLKNPENAILHTVLVEKNGLIHGLTVGSALENKAGRFFSDRAYDKWIQPD